jgi:hypothetical protein
VTNVHKRLKDKIVASISAADSEEGRRRGKNKKDAKG